jgi:hypothetical protein
MITAKENGKVTDIITFSMMNHDQKMKDLKILSFKIDKISKQKEK